MSASKRNCTGSLACSSLERKRYSSERESDFQSDIQSWSQHSLYFSSPSTSQTDLDLDDNDKLACITSSSHNLLSFDEDDAWFESIPEHEINRVIEEAHSSQEDRHR